MHKLKKVFHITFGLILITIGIAGLILPILDGVTFLLLGFILLSFESPFVEAHLIRLAHKYDSTGKWFDKLDDWMKRKFN